ncbi:MAG: MFS transporter [Rhodospirillaceae bacterium]|jgi:sugar phosphate permease|nr:MFS transporter [Rhodospirillaceae bacterium]MBT5562478.1 MFS transporter [Rhodospirillaceae bacterium]MBT6242116.1 MFS transporter [Rhodospirillaceae bacterium]MBT7138398.1 MFS transporter [Rhodospirillaceae bacterium]
MSKAENYFTRLPLFYGWIIIAVAFVTMAIAVNARTSFSLLFPAILAEFHWDRSVIAGAFSIGFVASGLFTPVVGMIMDRWGPRVVIPMGATMVIAGLLGATAVTNPLGVYATLGVLVISGSIAMSYISHSMFLPNWFVRKRGLAIGIAFSGVGFGSITLLPWFQNVINTEGWRQACIIIAASVVIIIPLAAYFQRRSPADLGLKPDGDGAISDTDSHKAIDPIVDRKWAETDWTLKLAMKTARFWWIFGAYFCALFVWYAVLVHQTIYLIESGFNSAIAATALGLVGLFGIAGQIGIGAISDRIGREWAWTLSLSGYIACYATLIAIATTPSTFLLYLMVIMQGLLGFGLASIYGAVSVEIFGGRRFATIFAVTGLGGNFGAGVGPWLTGYIFDSTGSYHYAFLLCIAVALTSIFCIWMASPGKIRLVSGQAARQRA